MNELPLFFLPKSARAGSALRAFATALSAFDKKLARKLYRCKFRKTGYFCKIPCEDVEIWRNTRSKMSDSGNIYLSIWLDVLPERNSYVISDLSKLDVLEISKE